jgi:hypothetical protein
MKILAFLCVINFTVISGSVLPETNQTIRYWSEEMPRVLRVINGENSLLNIVEKADRSCIEEKLKLNETGANFLVFSKATVIVISAYELCVENVNELTTINVDYLLGKVDVVVKREDVDCFTKELEVLEGNENSIIERCDGHFLSDFLRKFITQMVDIDHLLCSTFEVNEVKKYAYKFPIIKYQIEDESVRNAEKEKLKANFMEITQRIVDCGLSKL